MSLLMFDASRCRRHEAHNGLLDGLGQIRPYIDDGL